MKKRIKKKRNASRDFAREFVQNRRQLGTPFQSSRYLVETVAKSVVGTDVVEFGAGAGPITKGILKYHEKIRLTVFENNPRLLEHLAEINDPRLTIIGESAEDFYEYVNGFDCVVSGLPLTSMPKNVVHNILEKSKKAKRFIQYKYFPEGDLLRKYFSDIKTKIVLRNIPPLALVYICNN